ncbi:unnamed protein product [Cuscuta epithymum]|uniref:Nucleic acid-binding proteins superfamily n=1 Tax=Cuscuta epithymum TaxID=186058 RepID=A0AAV0EDC5_9ASTE|nr:unnamed protein product [Cuscuta epithymum]
MEIYPPLHEEEEDPFLQFIHYAKAILSPVENEDGGEPTGPGWSWIASRILKTCTSYSSGVTAAILLSDLSQAWNEQSRGGAPKKQLECISQLRKKHKRGKLQNTVTIDSIYEKKFLSLSSVIEAVIIDVVILPGTNIYMLHLGDFWSSNTIDLYLHRRFYKLADPRNGILKKGREVFVTGCRLRTTKGFSSGARLLPTEYLAILLDEDEDDDAIMLGAQFCSDSFSSICLDEVNNGASYSLYARIESIGALEIQGIHGSLQRKQITLVDNDGVRLKFLLWGEQVLFANLFSVGSMLAMEAPFIASSAESGLDSNEELCLEYGSATQLYVVPLIQHKEQVCVPLTQNRCEGSKMLIESDSAQGIPVSQVSLPCDSLGSIDFRNYPFRPFVTDMRDKMTGISLYGDVKGIRNMGDHTFSLKIEDATGAVWARLHFIGSWSTGRLSLGHTIFISGLSCSMTQQKTLELSWFENDPGASFVNISCLPSLLNSSCLHKFSNLSDLSAQTTGTHVCRVWLDQIEYCHVGTRLAHAPCGHFVCDDEVSTAELKCNFCDIICNDEVVRTFHLRITIADSTAKLLAWCSGYTATELLQITPDEFCDLPEEEQIMYPSSLENEKFTVALVKGHDVTGNVHKTVSWEITRAAKCE